MNHWFFWGGVENIKRKMLYYYDISTGGLASLSAYNLVLYYARPQLRIDLDLKLGIIIPLIACFLFVLLRSHIFKNQLQGTNG